MSQAAPRHDVFISHSTQDKTAADAVCAALEVARIRCWIAPRDIAPGSAWSEAIVEALGQCRAVVLIFSGHANESQQIRNELVQAAHFGLPILPFRIEATTPAKSIAYFIDGVHWLDALTPPLEAHIGALVETVRRLLDAPHAATGDLHRPASASADEVALSLRPSRTRRQVLLASGAAALAFAASAAAWWLRGGAPGRAARTVVAFRQPNDADLAKIRAAAAEKQFKLPEFAFAPPAGDVDPAALRFVGVWASVTGYSGVGRQAMLIVTGAGSSGELQGFLAHGPPVGAGWDAAVPAFTVPFVSRLVDDAFEVKIPGAVVSYVARLNPQGDAVLFSAQRPGHTALVIEMKPLWRATA